MKLADFTSDLFDHFWRQLLTVVVMQGIQPMDDVLQAMARVGIEMAAQYRMFNFMGLDIMGVDIVMLGTAGRLRSSRPWVHRRPSGQTR